MFIAALFITVNQENNPNVQYDISIKWNSPTKMNKELIYTWINHENIILSERKQTKSHILNDVHIKYKNWQIHRNKK